MIKKIIYISSDCYISTKNNRLELNNKNTGEIASIPIEDIGVLEIDSYSLTLSVQLLRELMRNNVALVI